MADVRGRRVRVHALAAPYAGSVPRSGSGTNQVVLDPSERTIDALRQISRITSYEPELRDLTLPEQSFELVHNDLENRLAGRVERALTPDEANQLDRPDAIVRLSRLDRVDGVVDDAPATTGAPLASSSAVAAQAAVPPRRRVRRGGSAPTGDGLRVEARDPSMEEIVARTPTTLGLSARIAQAAMRNLLAREPNQVSVMVEQDDGKRETHTKTNVREAAFDQALRPLDSEDGPSEYLSAVAAFGHAAHAPPVGDKEAWDQCAYEVTLAWSAGEEDAPYDVSLSVRNPERPARWTIDGLAWMPAVALIENGGALLERVLAAFGVAASDGALVALRDRLHDKMAVDSGVEPGTAVEIDAIECVGTASAPPALSTLASSLLELEHWSPHRIAPRMSEDGASVSLVLHTCPLLAGTLWPLTYAPIDDPDLQLRHAIEDSGYAAIAHTRTMSGANELMHDVPFDGDEAQLLTPVALIGTRLATLTRSPARWYLEHAPLTFDHVPYMNALDATVRRFGEAATRAAEYLSTPINDRVVTRDTPGTFYHPAAWGLLAPLDSIVHVCARMGELVEAHGEGAPIHSEFDALTLQLQRDLTRFNTIYLGVPLWTAERDELADLYEAAINGNVHKVSEQTAEAEAIESEGGTPGSAGLSVHDAMLARRKSTGYATRALDRLLERNELLVRAHSDDAAKALVGLTTNLGAGVHRTPEAVAGAVRAAVTKLTQLLALQRARCNGERWSEDPLFCLHEVEAARDAVAVTRLQAGSAPMIQVNSSTSEGRTAAQTRDGLDEAYEVLQSAMLDVHRAQPRGAAGRELSEDECRFRAKYNERRLLLVRAKLAVAAARLDPVAGAIADAHVQADIRDVLGADAARPGARDVLKALKDAPVGNPSVRIPASVFDSAFARTDPSAKIDIVLDAALVVVHALDVATPETFSVGAVRARLDDPVHRVALRRCPHDMGMVECVRDVLNAVSDVPGFNAALFTRRDIGATLCRACGISHRLCDEWMALEEAAAPMARRDPARSHEQVARRAARELSKFARRHRVPLLRSHALRSTALVAAALLTSQLAHDALPAALEDELTVALASDAGPAAQLEATKAVALQIDAPYVPDAVLDPDVPTERAYFEHAEPDGACVAPGFTTELAQPDGYGAGAPLTNDATITIGALARHNPAGAADALANAGTAGGLPPRAMADAVVAGLRASAWMSATADDGTYSLAQWASDAHAEDECELVELGGWNTTLGTGGERVVVEGSLVVGDTRGTREFVVARARSTPSARMVSDEESLRLAVHNAMRRLKGEPGLALPAWVDDAYAQRCADHGLVPVGRGTPERPNGMADVVCFEAGARARFAASFRAIRREGKWRVSNGRQLVGHMLTQEELRRARPAEASGCPCETVDGFLDAPAADAPARPLPPVVRTRAPAAVDEMEVDEAPDQPRYTAKAMRTGDGPSGAPLRPRAASNDVGAPIAAPEGRACHTRAAMALRAAVRRSVGDSAYAKAALIERIGTRSSAAFTADLVPGVAALEDGREHYLFCPHASVTTLRGLPMASETAWDAAAALLGLPYVLEEAIELDEAKIEPHTEDVDAPIAAEGVEGVEIDPTGAASTGTAFGPKGDLQRRDRAEGEKISNMLLAEAGTHVVNALSSVGAAQMWGGPLGYAMALDQLYRGVVAGAAGMGWISASNATELNRVAAQGQHLLGLRSEAQQEAGERMLRNVAAEYRRQVSMDVASMFWLASTVVAPWWEANGPLTSMTTAVLMFGATSDLLRGIDALWDQNKGTSRNERRMSNRFIAGSLSSVVLNQISLASALAIGFVSTHPLRFDAAVGYLLPYAAGGHWLRLGSVLLSVGVCTLRWSPRLGSLILNAVPNSRQPIRAGAAAAQAHWRHTVWGAVARVTGGTSILGFAYFVSEFAMKHSCDAQGLSESQVSFLMRMMGGSSTSLGLKLFHGAAVHALNQVLVSKVSQAMPASDRTALGGSVVMHRATIAGLSATITGLSFMAGSGSATTPLGYTGLSRVLSTTATWLTLNGATQSTAFAMVRTALGASGTASAPVVAFGLAAFLATGVAAASWASSSKLLDTMAQSATTRRVTNLIRLGGIAVPAYALGQLAATGGQLVEERMGTLAGQSTNVWNERVIASNAHAIMLVGAMEVFELGWGIYEQRKQRSASANELNAMDEARAMELPARVSRLMSVQTAANVFVGVSTLGLTIAAWYALQSGPGPAFRRPVQDVIEHVWNVCNFPELRSWMPGGDSVYPMLQGAFYWLPVVVALTREFGAPIGEPVGRQVRPPWLAPGAFRVHDKKELLEPRYDDDPFLAYLERLVANPKAVEALLVDVESLRIERWQVPALLQHIAPEDRDVRKRLALASAQSTVVLRPSPLLAALNQASFGLRVIEAMEELLDSFRPPEPLPPPAPDAPALACAAPTGSALERSPAEWFGAWLGEEAVHAAVHAAVPNQPNQPNWTDKAHIRIGGELAGIDALRGNPRNLGDLLKAPKKVTEGEVLLAWEDKRVVLPGERTLEQLDGVVGTLTNPTHEEQMHLARLGFALIPQADKVEENDTRTPRPHLLVNMLARNLRLAKRRQQQTPSDFTVYRYEKRTDPKETVALCRALVDECTMRLALATALRTGSTVADDPSPARPDTWMDRLEGAVYTLGSVRSRLTPYDMSTTLLNLVVNATEETVSAFVGPDELEALIAERSAQRDPALDLNDNVVKLDNLHRALADTAFENSRCKLTLPRQVAQIDAAIAHAAGKDEENPVRAQLPLLQTVEYAAVAALREAEGMAIGSDVGVEWERLDTLAVSGRDDRRVTDVGVKLATVAHNPPLGSVRVKTSQGNPFDFVRSNGTVKDDKDVTERTFVIYEPGGEDSALRLGRPNRATVVYLALRLIALATRTPGNGARPVVRAVSLLKFKEAHLALDEDEYDLIDASAGQVYTIGSTASQAKPVDVPTIALEIVQLMQKHATSTDRLAIAVALGNMRLTNVDDVRKRVTFDAKFPATGGANTSVIVSQQWTLDALQASVPGNSTPAWAGGERAVRAPIVAALAAAGVARGNDVARDVVRVSAPGLGKGTTRTIAHKQSHRDPAALGLGYVDAEEFNNKRVTLSASTAFVKEAWGVAGIHSPESAHRAAEALQVASIVAALQRQQPASVAAQSTQGKLGAVPDEVDALLREVLENGQLESEEFGRETLDVAMRSAKGGRLNQRVERNVPPPEAKGVVFGTSWKPSAGFLEFLDTFSRALSFAELSNVAGHKKRYVMSLAAMLFAIYASPYGATGGGVELMFDLLTAHLGSGLALLILKLLGIVVDQVKNSKLQVIKTIKSAAGGTIGLVWKAGTKIAKMGVSAGSLTVAGTAMFWTWAYKNYLPSVLKSLHALTPDQLIQAEVCGTIVGLSALWLEHMRRTNGGSTVKHLYNAIVATGFSIFATAVHTLSKEALKQLLKDVLLPRFVGIEDFEIGDYVGPSADDPRNKVKGKERVKEVKLQVEEEAGPVALARRKATASAEVSAAQAKYDAANLATRDPRLRNDQGETNAEGQELDRLRDDAQADLEAVKAKWALPTELVPIVVMRPDEVEQMCQAAREIAEDMLGVPVGPVPTDAFVGAVEQAVRRNQQTWGDEPLGRLGDGGRINAQDLGPDGYAKEAPVFLASQLAAGTSTDPSPTVDATLRLGVLGVVDAHRSGEPVRVGRAVSASQAWAPISTPAHALLQGEAGMPEPGSKGQLPIPQETIAVARKAGLINATEARQDMQRGVYGATVGTLSSTIISRMHTAIKDANLNGWFWDALQGGRMFPPGATSLANPHKDAEKQRKFYAFLKGGEWFHPGSTSWAMSLVASVQVGARLVHEARIGWALSQKLSFMGMPNIVRRAWDSNKLRYVVQGAALAIKLLVLWIGERAAPAAIEFALVYLFSELDPTGTEGLFAQAVAAASNVLTNGFTAAEYKAIGMWMSLVGASAAALFNGYAVTPIAARLTNPRVRELIEAGDDDRKGRLLPKALKAAGIGWLARSTVPQSTSGGAQSMHWENKKAILLTEYVVEMAALVAVGELRACSDPLQMSGAFDGLPSWLSWLGGGGVMLRDALWDGLKRDGALVAGLEPKTEAELKARATRVLATTRSFGNANRVPSDDGPRFAPIGVKTPRALGAYAALFGVRSDVKDQEPNGNSGAKRDAARPVVPLGHAMFHGQAFRVTDALRGAVAGGYDGVVHRGWPRSTRTQLATEYHRSSLGSGYTLDDALRVMIVQHAAACYTTSTLAEFALLSRAALRTGLRPEWAAKAVLEPLRQALATFARQHGVEGAALNAVPLCGLGLRRQALVEQGRLAVLWSWQVPPLPLDGGDLLRGAQLGMTDRYLRAKSLKRETPTYSAKDMTRVLYTLWTGSGAAAQARELVCVPFGDYDCRSFDDVVLDNKWRVGETEARPMNKEETRSEFWWLRDQLKTALEHTIALREALDAVRRSRDTTDLHNLVAQTLNAGYAPTVRTARNAFLPESVLGLSDVSDDDVQRKRYVGYA